MGEPLIPEGSAIALIATVGKVHPLNVQRQDAPADILQSLPSDAVPALGPELCPPNGAELHR